MRFVKQIITTIILLTVVFWLGCASKQSKVEKARLHYDIAGDLLKKGEFPKAIEQVEKAIEINPKEAEFHNLLGLIYLNRGYLDRSEASFFKALELRPEYAEVNNNLCGLYITKNLWNEAIAQCGKAVSHLTYASPEKAYHNMGWAYYKLGNLMKAIENYNKSLSYRDGFYLAHQNLGIVYFDMGKYNLAINHYTKAAKGCDFCPEPFYRLGLALFQVDKRKTALKSFKKCYELDEKGEVGKLCENFLQKYQQ